MIWLTCFPEVRDSEYLQRVPLHFLPPVPCLSVPQLPAKELFFSDEGYNAVLPDKFLCKNPDNIKLPDIQAEKKKPDYPYVRIGK